MTDTTTPTSPAPCPDPPDPVNRVPLPERAKP